VRRTDGGRPAVSDAKAREPLGWDPHRRDLASPTA
jgi:hypothetical protein